MRGRNQVGIALSYRLDRPGGIGSLESLIGLHKSLKIRALDCVKNWAMNISCVGSMTNTKWTLMKGTGVLAGKVWAAKFSPLVLQRKARKGGPYSKKKITNGTKSRNQFTSLLCPKYVHPCWGIYARVLYFHLGGKKLDFLSIIRRHCIGQNEQSSNASSWVHKYNNIQ